MQSILLFVSIDMLYEFTLLILEMPLLFRFWG